MAAPYLHIVHTQVRFGEADSWVHQGFSIALDSVAETLFVRCFTHTLSGSLVHYLAPSHTIPACLTSLACRVKLLPQVARIVAALAWPYRSMRMRPLTRRCSMRRCHVPQRGGQGLWQAYLPSDWCMSQPWMCKSSATPLARFCMQPVKLPWLTLLYTAPLRE